MSSPRLIRVRGPREAEGVVVVLHGGAARRGRMMVSPAQLSVLRMIPVARRVARAGGGRLAVYRLLNSHRGWDTRHTPVHDAAWAVEQVAQRHGPDVPVCLVGHSLGGRAAILAASLPAVRSVVALASYVHPTDADARSVRGRRVLFVHGHRDRIAPESRARQLATRLARDNLTGFVSVRRGRHAMLAGRRTFERTTAEFVAWTLVGRTPSPVVRTAMSTHEVVEVD